MTRLVPIPLIDEDGYLLQDEDGEFILDDLEEVGPQLIPCPFCRGGCFACGFTSWLVRD